MGTRINSYRAGAKSSPSLPPLREAAPLNPAKESRRAPSVGPVEPQPQTHYFSYILRQWNTETCVEFYLYPTVGTVLIHSVKPELTE